MKETIMITPIEKAWQSLRIANNNINHANSLLVEWISPLGDVYIDTYANIVAIKQEGSWR